MLKRREKERNRVPREWLDQFPMTGRSVLQNCDIVLSTKREPAGCSGNGMEGVIYSLLDSCLPLMSRAVNRSRCGTFDWRAVCGRTARTVRREGRRELSLPLSKSN